jgi:hypothetical protein
MGITRPTSPMILKRPTAARSSEPMLTRANAAVRQRPRWNPSESSLSLSASTAPVCPPAAAAVVRHAMHALLSSSPASSSRDTTSTFVPASRLASRRRSASARCRPEVEGNAPDTISSRSSSASKRSSSATSAATPLSAAAWLMVLAVTGKDLRPGSAPPPPQCTQTRVRVPWCVRSGSCGLQQSTRMRSRVTTVSLMKWLLLG